MTGVVEGHLEREAILIYSRTDSELMPPCHSLMGIEYVTGRKDNIELVYNL